MSSTPRVMADDFLTTREPVLVMPVLFHQSTHENSRAIFQKIAHFLRPVRKKWERFLSHVSAVPLSACRRQYQQLHPDATASGTA